MIYYAAGGTDDEGNPYIYDILDWGNNPGLAVGYVGVSIVSVVVLHAVIGLFTYIRLKISDSVGADDSKPDNRVHPMNEITTVSEAVA